METNSLPLCPCGSGKLYEECCYKKKGADGKPLFFKGAFKSSDGKVWHPIPNVRFAATIVGQAIDKYREYAKDLVTKSTLSERHHEDFINLFGLFYQSYEQLLKTFEMPSGKGVSFQMDTIEVRKYWKEFLFNGRILLDFVGLHSRATLGLNQAIGGLNEKKFELLLNTLNELGTRDKIFIEIKAELEPLRKDIIIFIGFRDKEKRPQDTIVEFPAIDDEHGLVKDGKVSLNGETFDMIKFIKKSYESIYKLTLILLGTNQYLEQK
jgi:hypothetical protein